MPEPPTRKVDQFIQGAPVLHVPDVRVAAEYYRDVLGFTFDFAMDEYAVVWRENAAVHFCRDVDKPVGVHLFFWVKNVDALFEQYKDRDVKILQRLTTQPYGIREFSLQDPHGVPLIFGQDDESVSPE